MSLPGIKIKSGTFVLSLFSHPGSQDIIGSRLGVVSSVNNLCEIRVKDGVLTQEVDMLIPLFDITEEDLRILRWQQIFDKHYLRIINALATLVSRKFSSSEHT